MNNDNLMPLASSDRSLGSERKVDVTRAYSLTPEVVATVDDMFDYHAWDQAKTDVGLQVRLALSAAVKLIIMHVPPCPDRTVAIRKLREARMDCNSAITHDGRY